MVVGSENAQLQSSPGPAIALLQPGSGPVELQPVSGLPNDQLKPVLGLANAQLQLLPIGENATGETAFAEATSQGLEANASMSTEIIPALISFESTAATNQTQVASVAIIAQEIPSPKLSDGAEGVRSHGKGHNSSFTPTPTTAECDCPDYMTGI